MSYMKRLLEDVQFWIGEYEKENGKIHEDDYEKIFIKYYIKAQENLQTSKNNQKNDEL